MQWTDSDRAYVEQARLVHAYGGRALQVLNRVSAAASSVLRVGVLPDIDPLLLDILYAVHLPLYPSLRTKLDSGSSTELAHDLMSAHLDLALITRPDQNPKLTMGQAFGDSALCGSSAQTRDGRQRFAHASGDRRPTCDPHQP